MKYTPGPWKTKKEDKEFIAIYADNVLIADVLDTNGWCSRHNASLIAASPDLLNALQALIYSDVEDEQGRTMLFCHDLVLLAQRAIAKATKE